MNDNRDFKGIWIPAEIWLDKDLNWIEKILLREIDSLSGEKPCWATNKYFAEFFGLSERSISRYINNLKDKKKIKIKDQTKTGGQRFLTPLDKTVYHSNTESNTSINKLSCANAQNSEIDDFLVFSKTLDCIQQRAEQLGVAIDEQGLFWWLESADWELGGGLKVNSFFGLDKALQKWHDLAA